MCLLLCHGLPRRTAVEDQVADTPVGLMTLRGQAVKERIDLLLIGGEGITLTPALR